MKNSRLKYLLILGIVLTLIAGIGSTYSFFIYRQEGSNVSLESGEISINYSDNVNYISVPDAYPVSDEVGKIYPYYSDFTLNSVTDKHPIKYEIQIIPNSNNTIDTKYIKVYLADQDDNPITQPMFYDDLKQATYNTTGKIVDTGFFTTSDTQNFRLRVWIDESYDKNLIETFGFNIYLYATNSGLNDATTLYERAELTLADKLTDYDIDGTRYVYGETVDNNYVWYSGKMWRIVALNSYGTIKLVTQDNMTSLSWYTSSNTDYSQSQIRSWLNTEFLPTINSNLIVESNWDYTTYESFPTEKDTENEIDVTNRVGLLNVYDFMMTGGTFDQNTSKTYLNNSYNWWTTSPKTSGSYVWLIDSYGYAYSRSPIGCYGVRPSVNLKSNITLTGEGNGTIEAPYKLEGDTQVGQASELLSTRISGEYIKFNNAKYRIVGTENGLTKITMADYSKNKNTLSTSLQFGASADELTFSTTYGIGKYLDDWYNATSETDTNKTYTGLYLSETSKAMIATPSDGVRWYAGLDSGTSYDYTESIQGTAIEATIGLGRYGEMFSTQFGNGYSTSTDTWLITKNGDSDVWSVNQYGYAYNNSPTNRSGVQPSFYLKSDVKITGGTGMPHDPYTISQ